MVKGSIDSIETFGLVDGPGIRTVVFLNGCNLRCKFCHNPEMWKKREFNYDSMDIVKKVLRSKPYFKNGGGVTFSGGEPLLHIDFLLETCKELKKEGIHIALDTAGVGLGNYNELLKYVDLVILDVKAINDEMYFSITGHKSLEDVSEFIKQLNNSGNDVWVRQVIIPDINDNLEYMDGLASYIKDNIKNVKKVEFLPFHRLGREKYIKLGIPYPYEDKDDMNKNKCDSLYEYFQKKYTSLD